MPNLKQGPIQSREKRTLNGRFGDLTATQHRIDLSILARARAQREDLLSGSCNSTTLQLRTAENELTK